MSNDDRRRFFRITDFLGVAYKVVDSNHSIAVNNEIEGSTDTPVIEVGGVIKNHNKIIDEALAEVDKRDPHSAKAINQLNKKVDAILMMMELDNLIAHKAEHSIEEASISASGIAFPVSENLSVGSSLSLDLILKPSKQQIKAMGKVIECESITDSDQYYLRVEFTEVDGKDREGLIQHIVQRQGALLRTLQGQLGDS